MKADPDVIAELKRIETSLTPPREPGLTDKNRERLRPLQNEETLGRLVRLPKALLKRARSRASTVSAARDVERAVAIALLLHCPVRRKNLAEIDLERNIRRTGDGRAALVFTGAEVKNHRPIEFEVPPEILELIDEHVARYRPLLAPRGSTNLFPCRSAPGPLALSHFSKTVSKIIRREIGVDINMHLFRHLAAWIWLEANPGSYEALRRLLGHAELSSTLNAYAGFEAGTSLRLFAELIDDLKDDD